MRFMSSVLRQLLLAAMLSALAVSCGKQDDTAQAPSDPADASKHSPAGRYGAYAFAPTARTGAFVLDGTSPRAADEQALALCGQGLKAGAGCTVLQRMTQGCAAIAMGRNGIHAAGTGATARDACTQAAALCMRKGTGCVASTYGCMEDQSVDLCKQVAATGNQSVRRAPTADSKPRGPYGAIAVTANGLHAGFADGHASQAQAEASAVATCASNAKFGAGRCTSRIWFKDACGALSTGDDGAFGTGWGVDPRRACGWALQTCRDYRGRNCRADYYVCSPRKLSGTCDGSFKSYR